MPAILGQCHLIAAGLLEGAVADEAQVVGPDWGYGGVLG